MLFEFWVWLLTTATACGAVALYGAATLRYRLGDAALEILALGVPFRTIPYASIQSVQAGGSLWNEHWVTFRLANRVTLQLQEGRCRAIVITPPDREAFLRELGSRLQDAHLPGGQDQRDVAGS